MTTPPSLAPGRREAAITAALTGAVVVVLGYASGLGLQVNTPSAAQPPVQPAAPTAIEPVPPPPAMTMPMEPAMPPMASMPDTPAMPAMPAMPHPMPEMPDLTEPPTEPPATEPTEPAEPSPAAAQPKCPPALLEQLPVVGAATEPVTSLLSSVLGSLPVLGGLAAPTPEGTPGALGCILGTVVGPQCCATAATVSTRVGR